MRKNYFSLPVRLHSLLWPSWLNEGSAKGGSPPAFASRNSLLTAAIFFIYAAQTFAQTSYCTPAPSSVDNTGIINVTIGTINNTTVAEPGRYGNYSAQVTNVGQGVTQPFSITFSTGYDYNTKVWIDWNNDFDFDDEGEQVFYGVAGAARPSILSGTFTVPVTASLGNHRLRIGGLDDGGTDGEDVVPCYDGTYGTFEDYTINVTLPPACFTPTSPAVVVTASNTANLSWAAPALGTTPVGYQYVVDLTATAPASGATTTATTTTSVTGYTGFADNTNYYLHVRTNCGDGFSEWVTSSPFRYIGGDTCAMAIDLGAQTSPLSSTTVGAADDFTATCGSSAATPDLFYSISVPVGYKLSIGQTANNYDSVHTVFYGTCENRTQLVCQDYPELPADGPTATLLWENTTGSTQTVYWVQGSYNTVGGTFTLAWTLTPPPACNIPTAVTAQLLSGTQANISWNVPVTGTPSGYQYAITTSATPPATGTATTATSVNGVTVTPNETTYLHVRTQCGENEFSAWVTYSFFTGYCTPAPTSVDGQGITNVTIGSINNTTVAETNNYGNYSTQIVNVGQGVTQPFSITFRTNGADYVTKIWIDWNNDLDFNDEGEEVYAGTSASTNPAILSGTFTVPATASLGNHRIRIGGTDYGPTPPCYTGSWGSYEDYTINVTTPPACFVPSALTATNVSSGVVNVSWTAPTLGDTAAGYEYVIDTTLAAPTVNGTAITGTSATNVTATPNVTNYLHVRTKCSETSFSEWVTISFLNSTCIPRPSSVDGQGITNVTIGSINNTTVAETNNYGDYTAQVVNIGQGVVQPFSITYATNSADYITRIWVDWNNDLDFDDEGEEVFAGTSAATNPAILSGTFTVPATASLGNHRLRIGGVDFGTITPCYTGSWGSFEDYTINVTNPPSCFTPTSPTAVNASAGFVNISWTAPVLGTTPAGYEYVVDTVVASPTVSGTATTETSVANVAAPLNVTGYLHVRTNCGDGGYSEWVTTSFYNGVCIPRPTSVDGTGITNVTIGSINNTTVAEANNYGNYSSQVVNIGQGVTQPFSITFTTNGADYITKMWVDWNDDLDFDDEGEEIFAGTSAGTDPAVLTGTFTVPATATLGNHRLRIGGIDFGTITPCYTGSWGTFEDYTINVTTPPSCFTPTNAIGAAVAQNTADLSWTAPTLGGTPVGYEYVVDTTAASPSVAGTAVTGTSVTGYTGIADDTYYYLHVRTVCGDGDFSEWVTSPRFRYLRGDTCATAISLDALTSPYSSTTVGAGADFSPSCRVSTAPELFYSLTVPNGYTVTIGLTASGYDSVHSVFYGSCTTQSSLECTDNELGNTTWENLTGSSQTLYWVQDGWAAASTGTFTLAWTLVGPVTCDKPRDLEVNLTSLTTANISWTVPNTGSPEGYEYAVTTSATPPASGTFTATTSVNNITVTPNVAQYLHVRAACGTEDGFSVWVTLPFFSGYCVPSNTTGTAYYITSITTTGGSTNIATSNATFSGFTDYTATQTLTTYAGGAVTFQATTPNTTDDYLFSVWVDWNNDFDFDDMGERVLTSDGRVTSPVTIGTLNIPVSTAEGTYRMRIRNAHVGSPVPACGEDTSGEAEDYTLVIEATPECAAPYNLTIDPTDAGFANLNWSPSLLGSPAASYEYVFGPSSTPPAAGVSGIPSDSFFVGDAEYDATQSVYLFVRSVCGANEFSEWSAPASILDFVSPELLSDSVMVYKDGNAINITSGTTQLTGVTIYDTRGRNLYTQSANSNSIVISDLQVQQQVIILQVNTTKGTVSKRIVF
jgi:ribosomal protein L6P/L9E